jgi:2-hydroxychromene-2-carboxylate isomerase
MAAIDYYFSLTSPYAYLGHAAFLKVAAEHGAEVRYRPVALPVVFEHTGGVPLPQRPKARRDYRFIELQRWRAVRGLPLNLQPRHFPADPTIAHLAVIALVQAGADPASFMDAVFRAVWAEEKDIADRAVLAELLRGAGHDSKAVLAAAETDSAAAIFKANTDAAIAAGVIGAPTYVLNGEPFWGQDRIELLADALKSGRPPYRPPPTG